MPKREHLWLQMAEVDSCRCEVCGLIASNTAIACRVGIPTAHGWVTGEGSQFLPDCHPYNPDEDDLDPDEDMTRLLAGELPPAP